MSQAHASGGLRTAVLFFLCALFFLPAMGISLLGSNAYRDTVADSDANATQRTALSYLVNQARRGDHAGGVAVGSFGGGDALRLTDRIDGYTYVTLLYCYDGQLCELFMEEGTGLGPADGTPILPLDGMALSVTGGILTVSVTDPHDGAQYQVAIAPRCGIEEVGAF